MSTILGLICIVGACYFLLQYLKDDFDDSVYHAPMPNPTNAPKEAKKSAPKKTRTAAKSANVRKRNTKPSKQKPSVKRVIAKNNQAPKKKPMASKKSSTKKRNTQTDDLTRINGIGPKIAVYLNSNGVKTFQRLAKFEEPKLRLLVQKSGIRVRQDDPSMWIEQAKLAQKSDWEGLKKVQQKQKVRRNGSVKKAA